MHAILCCFMTAAPNKIKPTPCSAVPHQSHDKHISHVTITILTDQCCFQVLEESHRRLGSLWTAEASVSLARAKGVDMPSSLQQHANA